MYALLKKTTDPQGLMRLHSYAIQPHAVPNTVAYQIDADTQSAIEDGGFVYIDEGQVVVEEEQRV